MLEKIKKNKNIVSTLLLLCLVGVFVNASDKTDAWFTDNKVTNQTLQVGDLKLDLTRERQAQQLLEPGATYDFYSEVKNIGSLDGQLRVKITPFFVYEDVYNPNYFYESNLPTNNVLFNFTQEFLDNFELREDGYYYYIGNNTIFYSDQNIRLFDSVTLDGDTTGNEYNLDDKYVYLTYQIIAEIRQVPSSIRAEQGGLTYNIHDDAPWDTVTSEPTIYGYTIYKDAPEPLNVLSVEREGEYIVFSFSENIEERRGLGFGSSGELPLLDVESEAVIRENNVIKIPMHADVLLPENLGETYQIHVLSGENVIYETFITIE